MEEYQIWTLFQNARIANGLTLIATVLIIWLSLRTAMQTRRLAAKNPILSPRCCHRHFAC